MKTSFLAEIEHSVWEKGGSREKVEASYQTQDLNVT